jgi:NAD-specific glutamate dehydrogenase
VDQTVRALLEKDLQGFEPAWRPGHPDQRGIFERFVRIVTRRAEDSSLAQRPRPAILLELQDSLRFIAVREPRRILVRVFDPGPDVPGVAGDRTVFETCTADQPFLVDTVRLTCAAREFASDSATIPSSG